MSKTIGVIGLGSIGMRHAKNLIAMGHKVLGYDPDMKRRLELNGVLWEPHEIFDDNMVDGLVIASPTEKHLAHLADASGIGVPVFMEKPIAHAKEVPHTEGLDYVLDAMAAQNIPIMVGNNLRFHSCVKKAKEWLAKGKIGKPLWASFTISQKNEKYTDPCILNWGAHECDLALYLLGPAMVTAAAGSDDLMDVLCLHEYNVPSAIHCDYLTPVERRGFCILGTKGNIGCDLVARTIKFTPAKEGEMVQFHVMKDTFDENYVEEMRAFIDLIDGKPAPNAATGQDGLHTLELILEAQRMAGVT